MAFGDRVRAVFGMRPRTFDEPRTARFTEPYQPINTLIEGLMAGLGRCGREEALGVPAVLRGRNMICSISTLPLQAVDADNRVQDHPLLRQIDDDVPNVVTLAQLVEDLFFEAQAWLRITGFGWDGYPVSAVRYAPGQVSMNPPVGYDHGYLPSGLPTTGVVWMAGEPVPWSDVIRFDSPNPAVLVAGQGAIKRAIALDQAATLYASNPQARGYFSPADPNADPGTDDDIRAALDAWALARRERVDGYVPASMTYNTVQNPTPVELQLVQMQQRADLALANMLGIDPEDLGINTTSRVYQNAIDRRKDRVNDVLAPYMRAITDRLGMPDVTKRGVTVRFVLDDYLKADPLTRAQVQETYSRMGVTDAAEIRENEGLPPRVIHTPAAAPSAASLPPRRVPSTTGEPVGQLQAADPAPITFARENGLEFDYEPDASFAVDQQARTITGLAVPWGKVAKSGGRRYRFARGSVKWGHVNRVKLLRDHVNSSAIGKAVRLEETDDGLVATFHVSAGRSGDEALALAADEVLDGLSIGVDFRDADVQPDPQNPGAYLVTQAALREVSLTAVPAFDDSRLTSVKASRDGGNMPCATCGQVHAEGVTTCQTNPEPTAAAVTFSADQFSQLLSRLNPAEPRPTVNPTRTAVATVTSEPVPYRFDRAGNFAGGGDHEFTADVRDLLKAGDKGGTATDAGRRAMDFIRADFATVVTTDVDETNPAIQRPDLFVDKRDYQYPLWNIVNKGAPPNGVQPFVFPKYNTSGTLVAAHTEGTEPTAGGYTTTSQTVTPSALSGKASITREVFDMGGNPAVSQLIRNQMRRDWFEGLELAAGTFLNTLTAAADISLNTGATGGAAPTSAQLLANWDSAVADLMFTRAGQTLTALALEPYLYKAFVNALDGNGRPLFPILNPQNANGSVAPRFRTIDVGGITGVPAWGLGAGTGGSVNNSWLFDPATVWGFATAPQYFDFPGTASGGGYAPVAMVDIAVWGYKAFANSDINGVRQVTYDTTT